MFTALAAGTAVRLTALRGVAREIAGKRLDSLKSWWIVFALVVSIALLGVKAAVFVFAAISLLALREFMQLAAEPVDRRLRLVAYAIVPFNYLWIWFGWSNVFVAFLPLVMLAISSSVLVVTGQTAGFVRQIGRTHFATLISVYCLAYAALLFQLSPTTNSEAGVAGWFLFLVLLTESNDIIQALVGRRIGRHKITPHVSPHKTWEGFVGGVIATLLLALALAPWLTPLNYFESASAGFVIALAGFFGDLNMSAVKRDAGVKDSSGLIPGQGGILDRIDSLTFSAPAFYFFVVFVVS